MVSLVRNTLVTLNPEWVVTLNRNQVVTFSEISTWADKAFLSEFQGDADSAKLQFRKAMGYERDAAFMAINNKDGHPSEGILLRSAATLAYFCGEYEIARELAEMDEAAGAAFEIRHEIAELLADLKDEFLKIADKRKVLWRKGEGLNKAIEICGIPVSTIPWERISVAEKFLEWAPKKAAELAESLYASILFTPDQPLTAPGPAEIFNRLQLSLKLNP